mgnify:CR=1 FL=1
MEWPLPVYTAMVFSLVRKVFEKELTKEGLNTYYDELGTTLGEALIAPTRIYVKALRNVRKQALP